MSWFILFLAGLFEVAWAVGLKYTEGFTRLWPSVLTALAMAASIGLLGLAMKHLPLGTAYAIWTGIGALGTAGLVAVAITAVVLVAALTVYLVGMFSHRADSPITSESARDGADQVSEGIENGPLGTLPVIIAPLTATAWG